jgi:hypothetical protein
VSLCHRKPIDKKYIEIAERDALGGFIYSTDTRNFDAVPLVRLPSLVVSGRPFYRRKLSSKLTVILVDSSV